MRLFTFYRSLASWRVRIALSLKGIEAEQISIDLLAGAQHEDGFISANPEASVPVLEIDGHRLAQSLAILEYLEETRPTPPLLPVDAAERALARRFAQIAAADSHPLIVPRVRSYLSKEIGLGNDDVNAWARHWMERGCAAMEKLALEHGVGEGGFLFGARPGFAEACLVPHLHGTRVFEGNTERYPCLSALEATCMNDEAFSATHPKNAPDYPTDST